MTFYILLSIAAIVTAVVGCALIWGYDVARAREIATDKGRRTPPKPELDDSRKKSELEATPVD